MTHDSPYAPTVGVHVEQSAAPRVIDGGACTKLLGVPSFSNLSPAVWVPPVISSLVPRESGWESASPQVWVVHASAASPVVDVEFWDGATVTTVSDESAPFLGETTPSIWSSGQEGEGLRDNPSLPGPAN